MKLSQRFQKAWWSITREGPLVFGRKLLRFSRYLGRLLVYRLARYLPKSIRPRIAPPSQLFMYLSNELFEVDSQDISRSRQATSGSKPSPIKSVTWFVPYFDHLAFGGIYTIFRFIEGFAKRGVDTRVVIWDNPSVDLQSMKAEISGQFPGLKNCDLATFNHDTDKIENLPASDIAVCTTWQSAYVLLRYNQTHRKYYFIQDYEPLFYPAGSMYALAESTYRFGFNGIVNTPGLLRAVNQRHGLQGVSFTPAINGKLYYPPKKHLQAGPVRIFFYARASSYAPRNAFELGVLIMRRLKKRYGDKIEIVAAGSHWNEAQYGLKGKITNLGLLHSLEEVADLYRSCHIGFVYMLTKHPSYQPFEFMASGMATVTNYNEDNLWFLQDGTNCLLAEPSPAAMAEKIGWLVDDPKLRQKISEGGVGSVSSDWEKEVDLIWNDITKSPN
jgi:O-antigen biosynthesis protein